MISPFGKLPLIEPLYISMEVVLIARGEVDASIYWYADGENILDNTHWCELETIRDHGGYYCKECKDNGRTKTFGTSEALYLDHFSPIIEAVNQVRELGYVFAHTGEGWSAVEVPKPDEFIKEENWVKVNIEAIELAPLKARKGVVVQ